MQNQAFRDWIVTQRPDFYDLPRAEIAEVCFGAGRQSLGQLVAENKRLQMSEPMPKERLAEIKAALPRWERIRETSPGVRLVLAELIAEVERLRDTLIVMQVLKELREEVKE